MALDPQLLEVLACPVDKGPLLYLTEASVLYNPRLRCAYDIVDDIPVMLVEASREVDDAEHARLVALGGDGGVPTTD